VTVTLDSALKARLRAVLDCRAATEAELRKLTEEGDACILILDARLARSEHHLSELSSDPTSSLAEIAAEMRAVDEVRPDLDELHALLTEVGELAREFRASWLSGRSLVDQ
jgi:hypothetical protein